MFFVISCAFSLDHFCFLAVRPRRREGHLERGTIREGATSSGRTEGETKRKFPSFPLLVRPRVPSLPKERKKKETWRESTATTTTTTRGPASWHQEKALQRKQAKKTSSSAPVQSSEFKPPRRNSCKSFFVADRDRTRKLRSSPTLTHQAFVDDVDAAAAARGVRTDPLPIALGSPRTQ